MPAVDIDESDLKSTKASPRIFFLLVILWQSTNWKPPQKIGLPTAPIMKNLAPSLRARHVSSVSKWSRRSFFHAYVAWPISGGPHMFWLPMHHKTKTGSPSHHTLCRKTGLAETQCPLRNNNPFDRARADFCNLTSCGLKLQAVFQVFD